jgi:hypothetical protein
MTNKELLVKLRSAHADLRKTEGFNPEGVHWRNALRKIKEIEAALTPQPSRVPNLGPIVAGGRSILLYDCTHITDGVGWPAFDHVCAAGTPVLAPESIMIYDNTSGAQGGDAFYGRGASGMRYWFGHIAHVPRQGMVFAKGKVMTVVSSDHPHPHVHLGIDAKPLIGRALISHTDYTHGAPLIGKQLAWALDS